MLSHSLIFLAEQQRVLEGSELCRFFVLLNTNLLKKLNVCLNANNIDNNESYSRNNTTKNGNLNHLFYISALWCGATTLSCSRILSAAADSLQPGASRSPSHATIFDQPLAGAQWSAFFKANFNAFAIFSGVIPGVALVIQFVWAY
jgi:hypothetical protein